MIIWTELRQDVLNEHIKHRPGSRPFAWWQFEDREPRRVVKIDKTMLACNDGKILESEEEYLERHDLLRKKEREAFARLNNETLDELFAWWCVKISRAARGVQRVIYFP